MGNRRSRRAAWLPHDKGTASSPRAADCRTPRPSTARSAQSTISMRRPSFRFPPLQDFPRPTPSRPLPTIAPGGIVGNAGAARASPLIRPISAMPPGAKVAAPVLPLMTVGQEIHADYGTTGLSLKGHPVQLIRGELVRRRVISAAEVWNRPHGRWVSVAGVVIIRQRPGTAKGIVFETLEDESGHRESDYPAGCLRPLPECRAACVGASSRWLCRTPGPGAACHGGAIA